MMGNTNSFKNKAYLIEDSDDNDISLANIHIASPCKKMQIPVINTEKGKPIGHVTELEECTGNINATRNYDLSENNLQCEQLLNGVQKEDLKNIVPDYKTKMNKTEINKPWKVPIEYNIILKDDNPVSLPMRRIPYRIQDTVKEKVDDLIEKDFVE